MVLIQRAMNGVGPRFGDQCYLSTGGTADVRTAVSRCGSKLLNGIERRAQNAGEGRAVLLIVHVHTVECDVALIAFAAVDRAAAIIVTLARITKEGHARLNRKKTDDISGLEGKLEN